MYTTNHDQYGHAVRSLIYLLYTPYRDQHQYCTCTFHGIGIESKEVLEQGRVTAAHVPQEFIDATWGGCKNEEFVGSVRKWLQMQT